MDLAWVMRNLPTGGAVSDDEFETRHRLITWFLVAHTPVLAVIGLVRGYGFLHTVIESAPPALLALFAAWAANRFLRSSGAALGLVVGASILVHFTGGMIESHFQWFVALSLIGLYVDVRPFLVGLAYTVIHHAGVSLLDPALAFAHAEGQAKPFLWTGVHVVFVVLQIGTIAANWVAAEVQERRRVQLAGSQEQLLSSQAMAAHRLAQAAADVASRSGTIRERIERSADSVAVIDDTTRQVGDLARQAFGQVDEAHQLSSESKLGLDELAEQSRQINELVALVQEIAARTNLLALNASIEAARAGDAGKGFAVVANEVKNLAATTAGATQQISEATVSIQGRIEASKARMDRVASTVAQIGELQAQVTDELEHQVSACAQMRSEVEGTSEAMLAMMAEIERLANPESVV